jgi:VanZ family protein
MLQKSFIPACLYFIITVVLLTLPGNELPKSNLFNIPHFDKAVHTGMFALLVVLFYLPFNRRVLSYRGKTGWMIRLGLWALAYGIVMEFVQKYLVAFRSFDLVDIVFDLVGCLIGMLFCLKVVAKK